MKGMDLSAEEDSGRCRSAYLLVPAELEYSANRVRLLQISANKNTPKPTNNAEPCDAILWLRRVRSRSTALTGHHPQPEPKRDLIHPLPPQYTTDIILYSHKKKDKNESSLSRFSRTRCWITKRNQNGWSFSRSVRSDFITVYTSMLMTLQAI